MLDNQSTAVAPGPRRFCPVCEQTVGGFEPGPRGRPNARCGKCQSLERHRFIALMLRALAPRVTAAGVLLDIAPSRSVQRLFQGQLRPRRYIRMDLDPGADGRQVDIQASMTAMPLRGGSIDLLVCLDVLEHIPDDTAAMADLRRVLSAGGLALIQVPFNRGQLTEEDPSAPVEERVRRFGQEDHVRFYGEDFDDRLGRAGLAVTRVTPVDMVGQAGVALYGLQPDEVTWLAYRTDSDASKHVGVAQLRRSLRAGLRQKPTAGRAPVRARLGWAARHPAEVVRRLRRRLG